MEELTTFVITECPHSLTPAVQVLKALASAGYLPKDFEQFSAWLWSLISYILRVEIIDKSLQVISVAYCIALMLCLKSKPVSLLKLKTVGFCVQFIVGASGVYAEFYCEFKFNLLLVLIEG